jgi:isoleucyl-tRNA synthetase
VPRRFGWDTHGVPVEHEIDKKLGITSRADVLAMGIDKYNAECRAIVMRYSSEWRATVERMGRWIDFDNDYKTLNLSFMESVWWAFKQLFDMDLVYRGLKVMPYSTGLLTPLSNFEAGQNYKEVNDPVGGCLLPVLRSRALLFFFCYSRWFSCISPQLPLRSRLSMTQRRLFWRGRQRHGRFPLISRFACTLI